MANNFASVLMDAITLWLPYGGRLSWAILEAAFCLISIGAVVWLTFVLNPKKPDPKEGFFGSSLSAADDYASHPISSSRAVQLFFNLPMILFFSLSAAQMISLIGRAWGYSYGM